MSKYAPRPGRLARYLSGLRVSAPIGTWVGVGGSLIAWGTGWSTLMGLVSGLVVLLLVGFVASLATAKTAKYRLFVTYDSRIRYLQKRVEAGGGPQATADLLEAKDQFDLRGPQWITGEGFVDVSRGVHKVEADLLDHGIDLGSDSPREVAGRADRSLDPKFMTVSAGGPIGTTR